MALFPTSRIRSKRGSIILLQLKLFLVILVASIILAGSAESQEEISQVDLEVIEMLEFLEMIDLMDNSDYELLEDLTEMGDDDAS